MSYIALPLGVLLWYLLIRKLGEKGHYTNTSKASGAIVCLVILFSVYFLQEYRKENYSFIVGISPSFLAAVAFPFALIVTDRRVKTFVINQFLSWSLLTFTFMVIYELVLWLDGRNFDIIDILASLAGSLIGCLIVVKLKWKTTRA